MAKPLPDAVYRIHPKRGEHDCAIASLATYLRRDYEEVLIAAGKISNTAWQSGLSCVEMVKVARKLGISVRWNRTFDIEDDTGVLWVSYHDVSNEHTVFLDEGSIYDAEHNPVSKWDHDDYMRHCNAFGQQLLQKVEV